MRPSGVDEREGLAAGFPSGDALGWSWGRLILCGDEALALEVGGQASRCEGVTRTVRDWGSPPWPARRGRMQTG